MLRQGGAWAGCAQTILRAAEKRQWGLPTSCFSFSRGFERNHRACSNKAAQLEAALRLRCRVGGEHQPVLGGQRGSIDRQRRAECRGCPGQQNFEESAGWRGGDLLFVVPFGTPKGQRKTGSEPQTDDEAGSSGINDPLFFPSHAAGLNH